MRERLVQVPLRSRGEDRGRLQGRPFEQSQGAIGELGDGRTLDEARRRQRQSQPFLDGPLDLDGRQRVDAQRVQGTVRVDPPRLQLQGDSNLIPDESDQPGASPVRRQGTQVSPAIATDDRLLHIGEVVEQPTSPVPAAEIPEHAPVHIRHRGLPRPVPEQAVEGMQGTVGSERGDAQQPVRPRPAGRGRHASPLPGAPVDAHGLQAEAGRVVGEGVEERVGGGVGRLPRPQHRGQ